MYRDILLTIDLNDETSWHKALPAAVEYCRAFGARLHVITVLPDFGMNLVADYFPPDFEQKALAETDQCLHQLVKGQVPEGLDVQCIVAHGTVYEEILATASKINADLIVMAAHRPELKDYLLGPNAARVVRHSDRSVLVVRT